VILAIGTIALFAGYPIIAHFTSSTLSTNGAYNLGGINATGQVPDIPGMPRMIDPDTPQEFMTRTGFDGNSDWELVFSDEFNEDGRTFYEGDDPFWQGESENSSSRSERGRVSDTRSGTTYETLRVEYDSADTSPFLGGILLVPLVLYAIAPQHVWPLTTGVDLHYWGTVDFEYYHPSAATTKDGNLVITISQENIGDLNFKSAMLQSWNKLCFQNNFYIEVNVQYPGTPDITGFWPGVWTMGNLGRPGYGATNEGTWPYSYDSCDAGTMPNQTWANMTGPTAALTTGTEGNNGILSL
jgi:beta-glucanase (GH16 family)